MVTAYAKKQPQEKNTNEHALIQLSKLRAILYHLYPGVIITVGFIILAPVVIQYGFPPQFASLLAILFVAVPLLFIHLKHAKKIEKQKNTLALNGLTKNLSFSRLLLYSFLLVVFSFGIWGITQPLNEIINQKLFNWLPAWYTVQNFMGYEQDKIAVTLTFNLLLNGFLGPYIEEFYFRGYLLPRMKNWGNYAFAANALFFSIYHFWQPYIYLTLMVSLFPMTWLVWKTKDLRLAILTHSLLNIVGALLSFGLLYK